MLRRSAPHLGLVVGLVLGATLSYVRQANASRNSSGTYSLPSGNPVVSGTTIQPTWANTTLSDLATEVTNSLDRNGRGAMLAPLQCSNGTVAAPALTFASDPDTGMYRIGANNLGVAASGAKVLDVATTGLGVTGTLSVSGVTTVADGTVSAPGVSFSGDANTGIYRIGANNLAIAADATKIVDVTSSGVAVTGTLSSTGVLTVGGFTSSANIAFTGSDPASTAAFSSTQTPMNLVKAWARVRTDNLTVAAGFNIASVTDSGANDIAVNFETDFDSTSYACSITPAQGSYRNFTVTATSGGTATVAAATDGAGGTPVDLSDTLIQFTIVCFGPN